MHEFEDNAEIKFEMFVKISIEKERPKIFSSLLYV